MWSSSPPDRSSAHQVAALRTAVKGAGLRSAGGRPRVARDAQPRQEQGSFAGLRRRTPPACPATGHQGPSGPSIRRRAADVLARSQPVGIRVALTSSPSPSQLRASSTSVFTVQSARSTIGISPSSRGLLPGAPAFTRTGLSPAGLTQLSRPNIDPSHERRQSERPGLRRASPELSIC